MGKNIRGKKNEQRRREVDIENNRKEGTNINKIYNEKEFEYKKLIEKLIILNPLATMSKGYSIVYKENNVVSKVSQLEIGSNINIKLSDGEVKAAITEIKGE